MKNYTFDYKNGYAAQHTEETRKAINAGGKGRKRIRFDVIKRDGTGETVVFHDITFSELQTYRTMAEEQGNFIL